MNKKSTPKSTRIHSAAKASGSAPTSPQPSTPSSKPSALDAAASEAIAAARALKKTIGLVQGSWDMFHLGHLCYLQEARRTCDFLVVAMDDDEKIRFRKGNNRPIIPLDERYQTIDRLGIADLLVVKHLGEPHWGLIKQIQPDVLVAIKENYSDADIEKLQAICGRVAILPRQATTSTSDIIRRTLIKNGMRTPAKKDPRVAEAVEQLKSSLGAHDHMPAPLPELFDHLKSSTDWITPTAACCFQNGRWYFGVNQIDHSLAPEDIENRSELFYSTVEHAEINLLKTVTTLDNPLYTILFPCDKCMKVLIDKGVKEIRYLTDHPDRNWSTRSHALAAKKGIKLVKINVDNEPLAIENGTPVATTSTPSATSAHKSSTTENGTPATETVSAPLDLSLYHYTDPRNAREQQQLDIMLKDEAEDKDPLDPAHIDQDIIFTGTHWYVTENRFPYDDIAHQFLIIALSPTYSIDDLSPEAWAELGTVFAKLRSDYEIPGGALCFRFGDTLLSGASLKRLHAHLVVPKHGSKTKFTIGGRAALKDGLVIP